MAIAICPVLRDNSLHIQDRQWSSAEHVADALWEDFTAGSTDSAHDLGFPLRDGRGGSARVHACPLAPGPRPVLLLDQVAFDEAHGLQARWPIEEAAFHLLKAFPGSHHQRPRLIIHRESAAETGTQHWFYEVCCSITHGTLIGYGTDPLGNETLGFARVAQVLGANRTLIDHLYPGLLPDAEC